VAAGDPITVLYVDDEQHNTDLFALHFSDTYWVLTAPDAQVGLEVLAREEVGVVVSDERMPGMSGIDFLALVREAAPLASRMVVSAYAEPDILLRAIQDGQVHDYLTKPWSLPTLIERVGKAADAYLRRRELAKAASDREVLMDEVRDRYDPDRIVGAKAGLLLAMAKIGKVAMSDATVLLRGESGTGKELLARAIHDQGARRHRPLVKVNCAALPEGVIESELFGHERGAFTGASARRIGRFELADEGTILLDEIGDLPPSVQVKLLRVLQQKEVERVGGNKTIPVNVRIIAATHRDLEAMVQAGDFREDLFYRLNVVPIDVPPLRSRLEDLPELLHYFLARYGAENSKRLRASPAAVEALVAHDWPGNVRELENLVERAVVLGVGSELGPADFAVDPRPPRPVGATRVVAPALDPPAPSASEPLRGDLRGRIRAQRRAALEALILSVDGNLAEAARRLGVPRTTLVSRARRLGLI
jgi:DNA-binding NtrC family response regulator